MSPGIGLMKRRLEKEKEAIVLAVSGIAKKYDVTIGKIVEKPIAGLALYHMPNT